MPRREPRPVLLKLLAPGRSSTKVSFGRSAARAPPGFRFSVSLNDCDPRAAMLDLVASIRAISKFRNLETAEDLEGLGHVRQGVCYFLSFFNVHRRVHASGQGYPARGSPWRGRPGRAPASGPRYPAGPAGAWVPANAARYLGLSSISAQLLPPPCGGEWQVFDKQRRKKRYGVNCDRISP